MQREGQVRENFDYQAATTYRYARGLERQPCSSLSSSSFTVSPELKENKVEKHQDAMSHCSSKPSTFLKLHSTTNPTEMKKIKKLNILISCEMKNFP
jgi:hypothetical protein